MIDLQSGRLSRMYRLGIMAVLLVTLSACAATGSRTKAYDRPDLPREQTATLKAPSTIKVLSINGRDTTPFMLEDVALDFSLKPGSNDIVFRYRSIWARTAVRENGDSAVNVVESGLQQASIDARSGETYTFAYDDADNVREARRLAQGFSARIVDAGGEVIARSAPYRAQGQAVAARSEPQEPAPVVGEASSSDQAQDDSSALAPDMSTLDALNLLWQRATREEKEAFLRRAFEARQ